jgi:hypothetical protein
VLKVAALDPELCSTSASLARHLDFGMAHAIVSGQGVGSAESLFFCAKIAIDFLLAGIVDSIFVAC